MLASSRGNLISLTIKLLINSKNYTMKKILVAILAVSLLSLSATASNGGGKKKLIKA